MEAHKPVLFRDPQRIQKSPAPRFFFGSNYFGRLFAKRIKKNNSRSKIVCIFQPHTYSRTKALFSDFVTSFYDADTVILMDIYPSLREEKDLTVSSELLAQKISQTHRDVLFLPDESSVVEYIDKKKYGDNTIIITMGAGDVYKISEKLDFR